MGMVTMDRQDKVVVMAGVVILIISIAGIVYHEKTYVASEEIEKTSYRVTWNEYSDEIVEEGRVDKEGWQGEYPIEIDGNAVITSIEVRLEWTDNLNFHGIIFPWNWTDKIDVNVDIPEMGFSQSASGYEKIELKTTKDKPEDFIIEVKNETEVKEKVKEKVMNKAKCTVSLSITPKPMFLDRGNDFTMYIEYHYYLPRIEKIS